MARSSVFDRRVHDVSEVASFVPYAHVRDLGRSTAFYQAVGLTPVESVERTGRTVWALLAAGSAMLMIAQADDLVDPHRQGVLFYLHVTDVVALRNRLTAAGLAPGPLSHPDHMPRGEFRLVDPDGYVLLIGQLSEAIDG